MRLGTPLDRGQGNNKGHKPRCVAHEVLGERCHSARLDGIGRGLVDWAAGLELCHFSIVEGILETGFQVTGSHGGLMSIPGELAFLLEERRHVIAATRQEDAQGQQKGRARGGVNRPGKMFLFGGIELQGRQTGGDVDAFGTADAERLQRNRVAAADQDLGTHARARCDIRGGTG